MFKSKLRFFSFIELLSIPSTRRLHPRTPNISRCINKNHRITLTIDPGFKQKRRVNNHPRRPGFDRLRDLRLAPLMHQWMDQPLEFSPFVRLLEHNLRHRCPINPPITPHNPIAPPIHQLRNHPPITHNLPHTRIRIRNHTPQSLKRPRHGRFPRSDPPHNPNHRRHLLPLAPNRHPIRLGPDHIKHPLGMLNPAPDQIHRPRPRAGDPERPDPKEPLSRRAHHHNVLNPPKRDICRHAPQNPKPGNDPRIGQNVPSCAPIEQSKHKPPPHNHQRPVGPRHQRRLIHPHPKPPHRPPRDQTHEKPPPHLRKHKHNVRAIINQHPLPIGNKPSP